MFNSRTHFITFVSFDWTQQLPGSVSATVFCCVLTKKWLGHSGNCDCQRWKINFVESNRQVDRKSSEKKLQVLVPLITIQSDDKYDDDVNQLSSFLVKCIVIRSKLWSPWMSDYRPWNQLSITYDEHKLHYQHAINCLIKFSSTLPSSQ